MNDLDSTAEEETGQTIVTYVFCFHCGEDTNVKQKTEIGEFDGYRMKIDIFVDTSKHVCPKIKPKTSVHGQIDNIIDRIYHEPKAESVFDPNTIQTTTPTNCLDPHPITDKTCDLMAGHTDKHYTEGDEW